MKLCPCGCGRPVKPRKNTGTPTKWATRQCGWKTYKAFIDAYKIGSGCSRCGVSSPAIILDLHHRDPTEKRFMLSQGYKSQKVMLEELAKCDVLCANCHRIVEAES